MWPKYLDLTDEQCHAILRRLELDAYSSVVSVFRAQGKLTKERRKTLQDLSHLLNVPIERHKAEIRRSINDELLNTVAESVSGPNSANEWAREGRRIIPLLKRASVVTCLTEVANKAKLDIQSNNKILLPPIQTKTFPKSENKNDLENDDENNENMFGKGTVKKETLSRPLHSPPPPVEEMIVKAQGSDGTQRICVRPPSISVPAPPSSYKANKSYFGGDIVTLPSGMIIRVKEEPEADENKNSGENTNRLSSKKLEESKKNHIGQSRKRKLSHKRKSMDEKESKVASFEVLKPTMSTNSAYIPGMPWPSSQQNYPALVQQLYNQLYQMQQQLQSQTPHRHSNSMPPPPPPMNHQNLESYQSSTGQYLSYHQVQQGKGKDRGAMLIAGNASPHLKNSGTAKPRKTPGSGRGRRTKNGEGRVPKKHQLYPINAVNQAMPGNANFTLVSGDPIPIQLEETKSTNSLKASNPESAGIEQPISTTESIINAVSNDKEISTASFAVDDPHKLTDDESSKGNNLTSTDSKLEKMDSQSTFHQVDIIEANKKTKQSKNTISNQQQSMKQQPHIIRHHASSHTQNLQLVPSSPATQRPKLTQASIASTIRSSNQNIAILSSESLASPKSNMAVNLATSSAKDLTSKPPTSEETEAAEKSSSLSQSGNVMTKVIVGGNTGTPIKLKEINTHTLTSSTASTTTTPASHSATIISQPINATSSIATSQILGSSNGKPISPTVLTNLAGMKVIPAVSGARILPKLTTTGATLQAAGSVGTQIYMVAAPGPGGQNVMRVARTIPTGSVGAASTIIGGSSTTQRIVTLNASNIKSQSSSMTIPSLSSLPITTGSNTMPLISGSTIRTIQQRNIVQTAGIGNSGPNAISKSGNVPSKPSVIVMRGLPHHIVSTSPKVTTLNKDAISGQRIVQAKAPASASGIIGSSPSNFLGKPIVIATKAPATSITSVSSSSSKTSSIANDKTMNPQGNVIVHLSQEQLTNVANTSNPRTSSSSNILSDIIQASGIMPGTDPEIAEDSDKSAVLQDNKLESLNVNDEGNGSQGFFSTSKPEHNDIGLVEMTINEPTTFQKPLESSCDTAIHCEENGERSESCQPLILDNAEKQQNFESGEVVNKTIVGKTKHKLKSYDIVSAAFEDAELGQFENVKNNQDNNDNEEVFGADVLNAAVELADHQDGNFESIQKGSKIYISQNNSSSDNNESFSYELYKKSVRNTASPNSIHIANVHESSDMTTTERVNVGQFNRDYNQGSQPVICQLSQNESEIGEEFLDQHAANDNNGPNVDDEPPPAMVIRSVTLN